jgi:hypothetical protein
MASKKNQFSFLLIFYFIGCSQERFTCKDATPQIHPHHPQITGTKPIKQWQSFKI